MPSQERKGLIQRPRLPIEAKNGNKDRRTTSRTVVLTTAREEGHEAALLACEERHFGQATDPTFTDHFTTNGLDHGL